MSTIKDVAREAGVSLGTVSNVLNGKESVKPCNKEKVYEAMKKLGFHYNMTASALRTKTTKNIGLILPSVVNPFYPEMARGIEDEARKSGFTTFLCNSDREKEKEKEYIEALISKGVDGIIILKSKQNREELKVLNKQIALVVEDLEEDVDELASVGINGYRGVILGMNMLYRHGHRRIGFISGPIESYSSISKIQAYRECLASWSIPFRENYVVYGDFSWRSGYEATKKLIAQEPMPTGIFAVNDMMAMGAIKAASDLGIKVPAELSVIGMDNIEMGKLCTPTLTTINQPRYEVGVAAFQLLHQILKGESFPEGSRHRMFETEIVVRESVSYSVK